MMGYYTGVQSNHQVSCRKTDRLKNFNQGLNPRFYISHPSENKKLIPLPALQPQPTARIDQVGESSIRSAIGCSARNVERLETSC